MAFKLGKQQVSLVAGACFVAGMAYLAYSGVITKVCAPRLPAC